MVERTILGHGIHDYIAFDHQVLQTRSLGRVQLAQRKVAYPGRPVTLEGFCVLTPGVDENINTRTTLDISRLEEREYGVSLIVNKETEWNHKALYQNIGDSMSQLGRTTIHTCKKVAVFALVMRPTIACKSSGSTGRTDSPARRSKWMIKSPITSPPDSSSFCNNLATSLRTLSKPD